MEAEMNEVGKAAYAELEQLEAEGTTIHELMDAQYKATGQLFGSASFMLENWLAPKKLRIQLAEEPPKETSVVSLAVLTALFWIALWVGLRFITFLAGRYL